MDLVTLYSFNRPASQQQQPSTSSRSPQAYALGHKQRPAMAGLCEVDRGATRGSRAEDRHSRLTHAVVVVGEVGVQIAAPSARLPCRLPCFSSLSLWTRNHLLAN